MRDETIETIKRRGRLAFMATVTACLVALALDQAARGLESLPVLAVYAFAAGFGLEFVAASWTGADGRKGRHELQR